MGNYDYSLVIIFLNNMMECQFLNIPLLFFILFCKKTIIQIQSLANMAAFRNVVCDLGGTDCVQHVDNDRHGFGKSVDYHMQNADVDVLLENGRHRG